MYCRFKDLACRLFLLYPFWKRTAQDQRSFRRILIYSSHLITPAILYSSCLIHTSPCGAGAAIVQMLMQPVVFRLRKGSFPQSAVGRPPMQLHERVCEGQDRGDSPIEPWLSESAPEDDTKSQAEQVRRASSRVPGELPGDFHQGLVHSRPLGILVKAGSRSVGVRRRR